MVTLFWAVFVASLFGSLHCAGMCGGLVAVYAGTDSGALNRRRDSHIAYNTGRFFIYVILGLVAGAVGRAVDFAGSAAGLQRFATVLAGAAMAAWGLVMLLRIAGVSRLPSIRFTALHHAYRVSVAHTRGVSPVIRAWLLGFLSALLPCGWLYAFVITAAGTADPLVGGVVMAAFWVGTLPIMVSLGVGLQRLTGVFRKHVPTVSALLLVVIGLYTIFLRSTVILPAYQVNESPVGVQQISPPSLVGAASCHDDK